MLFENKKTSLLTALFNAVELFKKDMATDLDLDLDNQGLDNQGSTVLPITESVVIYSFVLLGWYCVVPENIHTPPQTEIPLRAPSPTTSLDFPY